jgi:PEP-CTERM motif
MDTNQILNTGGFDVGCTPVTIPMGTCLSVNEASPWSLIPGQTTTPEPASILLLGSGLLSLGTFVRRKLRA